MFAWEKQVPCSLLFWLLQNFLTGNEMHWPSPESKIFPKPTQVIQCPLLQLDYLEWPVLSDSGLSTGKGWSIQVGCQWRILTEGQQDIWSPSPQLPGPNIGQYFRPSTLRLFIPSLPLFLLPHKLYSGIVFGSEKLCIKNLKFFL